MKKNSEQDILTAIQRHKEMVVGLETGDGIEAIAAAADMIIGSLENGGCVYICGNGGSAADAQHIAGELLGRFRMERRALAAIALTANSSVITSIANDYEYEYVFARQLEALAKKGDVLWAISTSGSSANVLAAVKIAREKGAKILAFTGKEKSCLEKISDVCFCSDDESTARSQEIHQLAYHIICDIVERNFCK